MDKTILAKLNIIAESWGGSIVGVPKEQYVKLTKNNNLYTAPFTGASLGIFWEQKEIVFGLGNEPTWPAIVHEMGHVFGCFDNEPPGLEKSESSFFGWEYLLIKSIRAPITEWKDDNAHYAVYFEDEVEFCQLNQAQKKRFIDECIREGIAKGNIEYKNNKYKVLSLRS